MTEVTIVTGASAGIGADLARECARRGLPLLLTARRGDRLEELAGELRSKHGVEVHVETADLSSPDGPGGLLSAAERAGLVIGGLINNAGFGQRGEVADIGPERQVQMVDLNVRALTELTARVLPGMKARRSGRILNVASTAAFQPGPYMAVYYATKAYVLSFTEAVHEEVRPYNIHVSALCPGPTESEFAAEAGMQDIVFFKRGFTAPSAKVAADGIEGLVKNRAVNVSGAMNKVMAGGIRFTPRALARRIAGALQD